MRKKVTKKTGFEDLRKNIIDRGLCTVCGTCAGVCSVQAIKFEEENGELLPVIQGDCIQCGICLEVCPGGEVDIPGMEQAFFKKRRPRQPEDLGVFQRIGAGYSNDETIRRQGASGGIVTQILIYALKSGVIDAAIVADFDERRPWQVKAKIADNIADIISGAQSKYAPIPINERLHEAAEAGYENIAVVGCPCHIHGVRKIQFLDKPAGIAKRVKLLIGLFCGTQFYFEGTRHLLTEWCHIGDLSEIKKLEYRGNDWPGHFVVHGRDGKVIKIDRHQYIYHMLMAAYKRDRCEMCLDWSSELADISVGDYWSPSMKQGIEKGHSTFITRSEIGDRIIKEAEKDGAISCQKLDPSTVVAGMGFELKKHAAAYRYWWRKRYGWPVPNYNLKIDHSPFIKEFHFAPETK